MKYLVPHSSNLVPKYKSTNMKKILLIRLCTIAMIPHTSYLKTK